MRGDHIGKFSIGTHPLYHGRTSRSELNAYFETMCQLWLQIAQAIVSAHELNIVLGDLSFTNVLVSGSDKVCIVDLESAVEEGQDPQVGLNTPGVTSPGTLLSGICDRTNDFYALGSLIFGSIMLATGFTHLYPTARPGFLEELKQDLGLSDELISLVDGLLTEPSASSPSRSSARFRSSRAVLAHWWRVSRGSPHQRESD